MRDFPVKAPGDTFTSEEFNESLGGELENFITKAGITLAPLTTNQMAQAATLYTGASTFFLESGVADAYIGNAISPFEAPPSLPDGFIARLFPGNTNTGASTLNLAGTGVKAIVKDAGLVALTGGEIVTNEILIIQFDLATNQWQIIQSGFQIGAVGAGAVTSVFGRAGDVVAVLDDYKASLVDNDSAVIGDTVKDALDTLKASAVGGLIDVQTFTASDTWTKPAGTNSVEIIVIGGGGGGGGSGGSPTAGGTGGTSSFGAFASATGGTGGPASLGNNSGGGAGGVGSGGDSNHKGGGGGSGVNADGLAGAGGDSTLGGGGHSPSTADSVGNAGGDFGGGGSAGTATGISGGGGGGGGGTALEHITAGLGATETVTIGAAGVVGTGTKAGGAGAAGIVIVKSYR